MYLDDVKYPGGYLITPKEVTSASGCNQISIDNYNLIYDSDVHVNTFEDDNGEIVLVGYCYDIKDGAKRQEDILRSLLHSEDIVDELEYINGRYFIIVKKNSSLMLYSDASQLQPLVFHSETQTLASHDHMLCKYLLSQGRIITEIDGLRHSELDFTKYNEIFKLNPSLALNLNNFNFNRIYPRNILEEKTVETVFEEIKPYINETIKWLKNNDQKKFLTITAGIDSRLSASITREIENMEYLTYITPQKKLSSKEAKNIYRIDKYITEQMKMNLKWNHSIINILDYQPNEKENEYYIEILNSKHSYGLKKYYKNEKQYHHALHIKSTVFGMGKADFLERLDSHEDTIQFYLKCAHGLPITFKKKNHNLLLYFNRNLVEEGVTKGRHYFDIFHLESRMGNWHSVLTLETDPETDEFILTNCRKIIDLIQAPSINDRRNFKLYKKIIEEYWPILLYFGINETESLFEAYNHMQDENSEEEPVKEHVESNRIDNDRNMERVQYQDYSLMVNENVEYNIGENSISVMPNKQTINFDDVFITKVISKRGQKIHVKSSYTNKSGLGKINVIIKTKSGYDSYDLLELNKGVKLPLEDGEASIIVMYNGNFSKSSWKKAGKLIFYKE